MVPSLLLLSASLVASPVIVSEVKATRESGHLRVEVRADGGIDPEAARARIDQGSLYLFLGGTRVKADNRAWKLDEGVGEIRAHRHHTETELDVPLAGNGCAGPVELEGTARGLTALVGCQGPSAAAPARAAVRVAPAPMKDKKDKEVAKEDVATPPPAPMPVKEGAAAAPRAAAAAPANRAPEAAAEPSQAAPASGEAAALKNLVKLPPSDEEDGTEDKAVLAKKEDARTVAAEVAPAPVPVQARVEFKPDVSPKVVPALMEAPAVEPPAKTASVAPSSLRTVGLPALFLAGLAALAYVFARKKRILGSRRIQILETASLGPKRSLVIARIGEETLVLGTSEAGITLLQTSEGSVFAAKPAAAPLPTTARAEGATAPSDIAADEGPSEMDQSLIDALADVPEPDGMLPTQARGSFRSIEGGLASLFGRKAAATAAARVEPKFDDILEDSVEDQELRRKLAAGMSARIR